MYKWREPIKFLGVIALIFMVMVVFAFALGWLTLPTDLAARQNVEEQFARGYEAYESLQATAQSVCVAQKSLENAPESDKSQRQSQLTAYETNYNRLAAEYDAWSRNVFEGRIVRPADLPLRAPSLREMKLQVCDQ